MKFQIDHDLHIHSFLSTCSKDPEQNPETILDYAKRSGLHSLCITDHYWDEAVSGASDWYLPQNFGNISSILPLPQREGISFFFGCEAELNKEFKLSVPESRFGDFDFIIIPTTHLHMSVNISDEDRADNEHIAAVWLKRLDAVLDMDLPFEKVGIAHLACALINKNGYLSVLDMIPNDELERIFTKAAMRGCGIELNADDFKFSDADADRVLRIFRTAKGCGCKFYLGSDAHHPKELYKAIPVFERAVALLDLKEEDKFIPECRKR